MNLAFFGIFMYRGLYFGFYDTSKVLVFDENKDYAFILKMLVAQGCVMGAELISYPTDTVKRKLMMQSGKAVLEYKGAIDCFRKTYQQGGLRSFWKGYISNIFRSVGSSLSLLLYDELKKQRKVI